MTDEQIGKALDNLPILEQGKNDVFSWCFYSDNMGGWADATPISEGRHDGPWTTRIYFRRIYGVVTVTVFHGSGGFYRFCSSELNGPWGGMSSEARAQFCDLLHLLLAGDI